MKNCLTKCTLILIFDFHHCSNQTISQADCRLSLDPLQKYVNKIVMRLSVLSRICQYSIGYDKSSHQQLWEGNSKIFSTPLVIFFSADRAVTWYVYNLHFHRVSSSSSSHYVVSSDSACGVHISHVIIWRTSPIRMVLSPAKRSIVWKNSLSVRLGEEYKCFVFYIQKPTTFPCIVSWNNTFELPRSEAARLMFERGLFFLESSLDKPLSYLSHPRLQAMACNWI